MDGQRPRSSIRFIVLLCSLLAACGNPKKEANSSGIKHWASLPIPIFADSSIVNSSADLSDFNDAMRFWEERAGKQIFNYQGLWTNSSPYTGEPNNPSSILGNVVFILNPWSLANNIAGLTTVLSVGSNISASIVMINPNLASCNGSCVGQNNRVSRRKLLAHELGHFIGLSHSNDSNNLMYAEALPGGDLSKLSIDQNTLLVLVNP